MKRGPVVQNVKLMEHIKDENSCAYRATVGQLIDDIEEWLLRMGSTTGTSCCWGQGPGWGWGLQSAKASANNIGWLLWALGCLVTGKCFSRLALGRGLAQRNCTVLFINCNWLLICSLRGKVELWGQDHVL